MTVIKTPKIWPEAEVVMDFDALLCEAVEEQRDIQDVIIKNVRMIGTDFCRTGFKNSVFENCKFEECDLSDCSFTDVIFRNCDFSNSRLTRGYFKYCSFISVKAMGSVLTEGRFTHVTFKDSNFQYANFDSSGLTFVLAWNCDFSHGALSQCRLKELAVRECRFIETGFFKTRLKGLDFSDSELAGIQISDTFEELEGACVNTWQAVELARLLKVVIRDMV